MKTTIALLASLLAAAAFAASAADTKTDAGKKELTPQEQRMSDCSKHAKGMKGDERKKFMSTCLKG